MANYFGFSKYFAHIGESIQEIKYVVASSGFCPKSLRIRLKLRKENGKIFPFLQERKSINYFLIQLDYPLKILSQ